MQPPSVLLATLPPHLACQRVVDEINSRWPPRSWVARPVLLTAAPVCAACSLTATFHLNGTAVRRAPPPEIPKLTQENFGIS